MNIPTLFKLLLITLLTSISHSAFSNFEYKDHMIASLLISDDPMDIKVAGKVLEEIQKPNTKLSDLAAIRLLQNHQKTEDHYIDANAWLIRALKQSKNKRYLTLLENIHAQTDIEKIKTYISSALPELRKGKEETAIDPDAVDYAKIKQSLEQSLAKDTFSYTHIDTVAPGETVKEIYNKLGRPSEVNYYIHSKRIPFAGRVKLQDIQLHYEGSGTVKLRSEKGDQLAHSTEPSATPPTEASELILALQEANAPRSRIIAKQLTRDKNYSNELLDAASNKIWQEKDSNDGKMVDAVAWLCRFVGASKQARYHNFMEELVNTTESKKVRKHAKKALASLPNDNSVTSFIPQ